MPLALIAVFLAKFDRQGLEQSECDVHGLKILCFDIRNITTQRADG